MSNINVLLSEQRLELFYNEVPWLKSLLEESGHRRWWRITAVRVQRIDDTVLDQPQRVRIFSLDFGSQSHREHLYALDAQGRSLVEVGVVPYTPQRGWLHQWLNTTPKTRYRQVEGETTIFLLL